MSQVKKQILPKPFFIIKKYITYIYLKNKIKQKIKSTLNKHKIIYNIK